ncbi:hypothetical protein [Rhizobium leguminosarum]|uniref:hypothetical protein n=1 Tax=Rhizobium leguminosarum TaxID=384 RepID=UPI000B929C70|nr:hypothetical protein [Rhizobium leguminosarum]ASS56437.1 hypothetical protein CHR56_18780 [Rhizobium leguminosarum bv. viciae]WSH63674.1 hypothetical protein U8Q05_18770 [Rhizobium ruizarguesonis]
MLELSFNCKPPVNGGSDFVKDIALFVAIGAATLTGLFGLISNRQKSVDDRELQEKIAEFGLMKSAFDLRFKDEFDAYKSLWPSLQTLINTLSMETHELNQREGKERAAIIDRDLQPVAEKLYTTTIFLRDDIRDLADSIVKEAGTWRVNLAYPALADPKIFNPPRPVEELERDLICLRDMIADRIEMMPGGVHFGRKGPRQA